MTSTGRGAVVVGGWIGALAIVRALGPLGVPIAVVTTSRFDLAHRSRWCDEHADLRGAEHFGEALRTLLERHRDRWRGRIVFPTNDPALVALAELHDVLPEYHFVAPARDVADTLIRKDRLAAAARALGIDVPFEYGAADADGAMRDDLRFPIVVHPVAGRGFVRRFGRNLVVVRDRRALHDVIGRLTASGIDARMRDFVPGGDDACYGSCIYLDAGGAAVAGLGIHTLRKLPADTGACRAAEPRPEDPLHDRTVALLRAVGHRGMAVAEYKRDARDGIVRLIDVDGRPFVTLGLAQRAGVDLVGLAWAERTGTPPPSSAYNGWRGRWVHFHPALVRDVRALSAHGGMVGAVWSRADPLPFVAHWTRIGVPPGR